MAELLSFVVPVYRNEQTLADLAHRLHKAAEALPGFEAEYLFVDDGSDDGSFPLLAELAAADSQVRVLRLSRNFGSNAAILTGLQHARGDAVVVIAADLQDPPELVPRMFEEWRSGTEIVLAVRESRDDPWFSRVFAAAFNRLFRALVFRDFPRDGFDFVLLDRRIVDALCAMPEKNSYLFGQVMWLGFRKGVVPYKRQKRPRGTSAWTVAKKIKYFIDAFAAFSYLPLRAASVLGFFLAGAGLAYATLVVALRLAGQVPERGYTALVVIVLVTAGAQLLMIGIIGEYLWRVLEEVRPRPPAVVATTLNIDDPRTRPDASRVSSTEQRSGVVEHG